MFETKMLEIFLVKGFDLLRLDSFRILQMELEEFDHLIISVKSY